MQYNQGQLSLDEKTESDPQKYAFKMKKAFSSIIKHKNLSVEIQ